MDFLATRCAALPTHLPVLPVVTPREGIIGRLEVEADERWSFVAKKARKPWMWIAMDTQSRHILACDVGDRSHESAAGVGESACGIP